MKFRITFFILFLSAMNLFGQQVFIDTIDSASCFHVIDKDTIQGSIPSNNNYTGIIEQFRITYLTRDFGLLMRSGERSFQKKLNYTNKEIVGECLNGKKIGMWKYFRKEGSVLATEIVEYNNDTVFVRPAFPFGREIYYIGDSSIIYGKINTKKFDNIQSRMTISFYCDKKTGCIYKTPKGKEFIRTDFSDLETTLYELENGSYNRKIRELTE